MRVSLDLMTLFCTGLYDTVSFTESVCIRLLYVPKSSHATYTIHIDATSEIKSTKIQHLYKNEPQTMILIVSHTF